MTNLRPFFFQKMQNSLGKEKTNRSFEMYKTKTKQQNEPQTKGKKAPIYFQRAQKPFCFFLKISWLVLLVPRSRQMEGNVREVEWPLYQAPKLVLIRPEFYFCLCSCLLCDLGQTSPHPGVSQFLVHLDYISLEQSL